MLKKLLKNLLQKFTEGLSWKMMGAIIVGAAIATFGVHNIHQQTAITEGGVIGMMLIIEHWFHIPSSAITPIFGCSLLFACF